MIILLSNKNFQAELNLAYCTFELKDINTFVQLFEEEKRNATQEIKELYERALAEIEKSEEGNIQDNTSQWKRELVNRLRDQEKNEKNKCESKDIFEKQIKLIFKIKAGNKTYIGNNWLDILSRANEPINIITAKLECPDLKKRIILEIREVKGTANIYRNRYIISGLNQNWVNVVADELNVIIANCNNNRKKRFEILSLLEPLLGLLITGSIFLLLRIPLLVTDINFFHQESAVNMFLLKLFVFSMVWLSLGVGVTKKLIDYINDLYPSIEISINNFERDNKRRHLPYIVFLIIAPYLLSYIISLKF